MTHIQFEFDNKNIYFASDFHLGAPNYTLSRKREEKIVQWLEVIKKDAEAIFLVGDVFDFWFEYKHTIPKGYTRFLGKLASLRDSGIPIYIFTGNHDMWMFDYFEQEFGIPVYKEPITIGINGSSVYVGHGDGLGPGDHWYKFLKKIFSNRLAQWLFGWLHPNIGMAIANAWSQKSRLKNQHGTEVFKGTNEWLWQYCKDVEKKKHHDLYIFGHRHLPLDLEVNEKSRYINLGEWVNYFTYFKYDGKNGALNTFSPEKKD